MILLSQLHLGIQGNSLIPKAFTQKTPRKQPSFAMVIVAKLGFLRALCVEAFAFMQRLRRSGS